MKITMEEFKKKVIPYLKENILIKSEAEKLGISSELFAEKYLETTQEDNVSVINNRYKQALNVPNEAYLPNICDGLTYQLELMLDDDELAAIKKRLNLDPSTTL